MKAAALLLVMSLIVGACNGFGTSSTFTQDTTSTSEPPLAAPPSLTATSLPSSVNGTILEPTSVLPGALGLPDIAGVVESIRPAVVSVVTETLVRGVFGNVFRDSSSGSGVIFDPSGYILTNNHVIDGANSITVTLEDGIQYEADVVGADRLTDLAVLKIEGDDFPVAILNDTEGVRVGDWVIAIGNALALPGGPTVTVGVISALDRSFAVQPDLQLYGLLQTDASINPGNSGGPLLNLSGEVVGINTAVAREEVSGRVVEGIGFAVGMDTAIPVTEQLIETGRVKWAWMGVILDDLDPQQAAMVGVPIREGVLITDLLLDGPAWEGGIRAGDVVVTLGGDKISTVRDLIRLLRQENAVSDRTVVELFREQKMLALEITLGERPPE